MRGCFVVRGKPRRSNGQAEEAHHRTPTVAPSNAFGRCRRHPVAKEAGDGCQVPRSRLPPDIFRHDVMSCTFRRVCEENEKRFANSIKPHIDRTLSRSSVQSRKRGEEPPWNSNRTETAEHTGNPPTPCGSRRVDPFHDVLYIYMH